MRDAGKWHCLPNFKTAYDNRSRPFLEKLYRRRNILTRLNSDCLSAKLPAITDKSLTF